jgi:metal-responsive CopG/Arc/MetJ family transcriptional regulator
MKIKTSITLSGKLLNEIDSIISPRGNRSVFIEEAIKQYIESKKKILRDQKDLEIINQSYKTLNREAEDILSFQVKI